MHPMAIPRAMQYDQMKKDSYLKLRFDACTTHSFEGHTTPWNHVRLFQICHIRVLHAIPYVVNLMNSTHTCSFCLCPVSSSYMAHSMSNLLKMVFGSSHGWCLFVSPYHNTERKRLLFRTIISMSDMYNSLKHPILCRKFVTKIV